MKKLPGNAFARMRRSLYIGTLVMMLGLVGCLDESPIISAHVNGSALSEKQVEALNAWLKEHDNSWMPIVAPPPAPSFTVAIRQASGKTGELEFFPGQNWERVIVFWSEDPANNRIGSFPPVDVANLRRELGGKQ